MAYSNAIYYINLYGGNDAARPNITNCFASNPSGTITRITSSNLHGLLTGAIVTLSSFSAWLNAAWRITVVDENSFDLNGAVWQTTADITGNTTPHGGSSWADAWSTITVGATATRIQAGDIIRISKSPAPISIGNAKWSNCDNIGGIQNDTLAVTVIHGLKYGTPTDYADSFNEPGVKTLVSSVNNLVNGEIIIIESSYLAQYDGVWEVSYVTSTQFEITKTFGTNPAVKGVWNLKGEILVMYYNHPFVTDDIILIQNLKTANNTYSANGAWIITKINSESFKLNDSFYISVGSSTGTMVRINSRAVVLDSAKTLVVDRCEQAWANGSGTASLIQSFTDGKEGNGCSKVIASNNANSKQAYSETGTLVGSTVNNYSKISFWIKNEVAIANATTWYIALCSNTDGTGILDTFPIPAIPSTGNWTPLTISRCDSLFAQGGNCGGNTSTDIKSIALYSGTTAPAIKYLYLDNIQLCTTNGLNLQSLISKNATEQSSLSTVNTAEAWYCIQSIFNRVVLLDNGPSTKSPTGRGYSNNSAVGSSEIVETFIRETFKTPLSASTSTIVSDLAESGTYDEGFVEYQGGYDISTGNQTGVTFFDGLNGLGIGINSLSKVYQKINFISCCRYSTNFYVQSNFIEILTVCDSNCSGAYGFNISAQEVTIRTIINSVNNTTYSIALSAQNIFLDVLHNLSNNNNRSIYIQAYRLIFINTVNLRNNTSAAIYNAGAEVFIKNYTSALHQSSFSPGSGSLVIQNANISEVNYSWGPVTLSDCVVSINKLASTGYSLLVGDGANMISQAATAGGSGIEWKITINSINRKPNYPFRQMLCAVPVNANQSVTVSLYVTKSHATNIVAQLVCIGGLFPNIPIDVTQISPNDTSRNKVTLATITPTESCVLEFYLHVWCIAVFNANVIYDDIDIVYS